MDIPDSNWIEFLHRTSKTFDDIDSNVWITFIRRASATFAGTISNPYIIRIQTWFRNIAARRRELAAINVLNRTVRKFIEMQRVRMFWKVIDTIRDVPKLRGQCSRQTFSDIYVRMKKQVFKKDAGCNACRQAQKEVVVATDDDNVVGVKRQLANVPQIRQIRQKMIQYTTSTDFAAQLDAGNYIMSPFKGKAVMYANILHKQGLNASPINFWVGGVDKLRRVSRVSDLSASANSTFQFEACCDDVKVASALDNFVNKHVLRFLKADYCRRYAHTTHLPIMKYYNSKHIMQISTSAKTHFFEFEGATLCNAVPIDTITSLQVDSKIKLVCTPACTWINRDCFGVKLVATSVYIRKNSGATFLNKWMQQKKSR